jgi:3-oxoacyl-[acyl-carrier protein] reductase
VTGKYAALGLMKCLAAEYASYGIRINAVSPSMMETKFLSDLPSSVIELSAERNPQHRNARTSDVIPAIEFLLSDETGFITGVNLPVTGGETF